MSNATKRSINRWIHLVLGIPIAGSVYASPADARLSAGVVFRAIPKR